MPERPDVDLYVDHLARRVVGQPLQALRIRSPFVLRTTEPTAEAFAGRRVTSVARMAKRIVLGFETPGDPPLFAVVHLMITGRLHWRRAGAAVPARGGLLAFDFEAGSLTFTESSKKKRAALHLVAGRDALRGFETGGIEITPDGFEAFAAALRRENHTLKRALTDQRILMGIGNAYSDEILWAARMSPFRQIRSMTDAEFGALFFACNSVLEEWHARLAAQTGDAFPEKVTAFHPEMAVHGRYGAPCLRCGAPVQRIVYADNEANYCAKCQTEGRLLADRALSRLLKANWPKRLEDLEGEQGGE